MFFLRVKTFASFIFSGNIVTPSTSETQNMSHYRSKTCRGCCFTLAVIMRSECCCLYGCERRVSSDMQSQYFTAGRVNERIWPCIRSQTLWERVRVSVCQIHWVNQCSGRISERVHCMSRPDAHSSTRTHRSHQTSDCHQSYNQKHLCKHFLKNFNLHCIKKKSLAGKRNH